MKRVIRAFVKFWFYYLTMNFGICNQIWTEPTEWYLLIIVITLALSLWLAYEDYERD